VTSVEEEAPQGEGETSVEEAPPVKVVKAGKAGKPVGKAKKEKKPVQAKTVPNHPKYSKMITTALGALKHRSGSSRQAILKYICANYRVDDKKAATQTRLALKRMTTGGELRMAKEKGKGAGCYKLAASSEKSEKSRLPKKAKKAETTKKVKKPATAKKTKVTKAKVAVKLKPAAKKSAAKKAGSKKPTAKKTAKNGKK